MNYRYGLHQRQTLQMTSQMQQSLNVLQMSSLELWEYVQEQVETNPLLELNVEGHPMHTTDEWDFSYTRTRAKDSRSENTHTPWYDLEREMTLEHYLSHQMNMIAHLSDNLRAIMKYIAGNLSPQGYLQLSLSWIADQLKVKLEEVEQALLLIHTLEPSGVGARTLQECLLIQANTIPDLHPLVIKLIKDHLPDIAAQKITALARQLRTSTPEIMKAISIIKSFNPKPGNLFFHTAVPVVRPDMSIQQVGSRYIVVMHDWAAPMLSLQPAYAAAGVQKGLYLQGEHEYIRHQRASALWLLRSIKQRKQTLLRVAQSIVEEQLLFFKEGPAGLKPMNLAHIADRLTMHESTVSRSIAGKYAATSWGTFELNYFFPAGLYQENGELASAAHIQVKIKAIITNESQSSPVSDQQIAACLQKQGIRISRRTVAKYREALGLASSFERKRR
ncbi:RNA polymerase factor sigma-54 [Paenibacillus taiwanensis]|uniref:RNA polymerase factor sigma-54 n=1 Tax=Paenibacillus taiwanensis TaxID=401638 RepID=UPI00048C4F1A|nr:RNA polymerase factor sigma-54 [Paenibacillus taiwanensis]